MANSAGFSVGSTSARATIVANLTVAARYRIFNAGPGKVDIYLATTGNPFITLDVNCGADVEARFISLGTANPTATGWFDNVT
jgi:hypothetical protein